MDILEGTLSKWTNVMNGWQYRWFVLDENSSLLSYYTSKEKMMKGQRRGCVRLEGAVIGIDDQGDNTFTITVDNKTFHFQARNNDERERWVSRLEETIHQNGHPKISFDDRKRNSSYCRLFPHGNNLELLDKRVTEADSYLQLMIGHTNRLEQKYDGNNHTAELELCKYIQNLATDMINNIKYSIVTLQIAKNMAHPINSWNSSKIGNQNPILIHTDLTHANSKILTFPHTSYSSSEDEENYFDACDHETANSDNTLAKDIASSLSSKIEPISLNKVINDADNSNVQILSDGSLDYDALYEDESDTDVSMESHGSVVSHLLAQVKIGMDLTKVILPTFILERRSLLEMYADYFAHPDLFIKIADMTEPSERIVQVCTWYLSAFHAGRKSSVAKKPYNPILGEIFQCYWESLDETEDAQLIPDGPIPWCKSNQLTFLAEQVSHHPPTFYAEHYQKQITFCAHVWTKSKFLGLSVGVHNIGQGIVRLGNYNEEYIVSFPNGYGRSILTVPWIELGGSVSITCPQTGYNAQIEFLTKPFYGGKRNRITAEIYAPNNKKPFVSIDGEWSGSMEAKWNDPIRNKSENFINVNQLQIHRKKVRPITEQEIFESRYVWKEVTAGLKLNDIERATNAKYLVEQKQRDEALARKTMGLSWNEKYFEPVGDAWVFKKDLKMRLSKN